MNDAITITLGGPDGHVDATVLAQSLANLTAALRGLEAAERPATAIVWQVVAASMSSPLRMVLAPSGQDPEAQAAGRRIAGHFVEGVRAISAGAGRPRRFDDAVYDSTRKLLRAASAGRTKLTLHTPDEGSVEPSPEAVANIDRFLESVRNLYEVGTIEGRLDTVTTRHGDKFYVWESLTQHRVECVAPDDTLLKEASALLRQRVGVTGRIRYREGKPVSIKAERLTRLRRRDELPSLDDLPVIDFTGGLPSEECVRRMRDGE